jgi:hypothetical protein
MKYVTGGYVGEDEAGERLAECVYGDDTKESGQYYSWNGNAQQVRSFSVAFFGLLKCCCKKSLLKWLHPVRDRG